MSKPYEIKYDADTTLKEIVDQLIEFHPAYYEYKELIKDQNWLICLESAGVDNWAGYDFAQELLEEMSEE